MGFFIAEGVGEGLHAFTVKEVRVLEETQQRWARLTVGRPCGVAGHDRWSAGARRVVKWDPSCDFGRA